MKSRKYMITLLIIIVLVVYYLLGTGYLKLRQQNQELESQIADAIENLAEIPPPPTDLEQQLTDAQAGFDEARNSFPGQLNTTMIVNSILKLGDDIGATVIPLETQPWSTDNISNYNYDIFRVNLAFTGTFTQLVSFVNQLENGEFETVIMEGLNVAKENEESMKENISDNTTQINASMDMAIYLQSPIVESEAEDS